MSLEKALNALKNKDFPAARAEIAAVDAGDYAVQHFLIKGLAESAMEDWDAARETFTQATGKFPAQAMFWLNRGIAEEKTGAIAEAVASQLECVWVNPTQGEAYGNLSNLYRKQNKFVEAESMARQALVHGANEAEAMNCLGLALAKQGKHAEAEAAHKAAHDAAPHNPDILCNRANLEVDQLRFEKAWPLFAAARAIEDKPVFRHDEALARLLAGDFETGWRLFEARLEMPHTLRLHPTCPRWQGEDLTGKRLLIVAEQGLGDVIQFCRYQKFIAGGDLVWAVPKALVRLLSGILRGEVLDEKNSLPACDYYVPMMSLPLATQHLHPVSSTIVLQTPATPLLPEGAHKKKIGLVWAGSPTHGRDAERSIPLARVAPILDSVAADFYAPFLGEALKDIGDLPIIRLDHLIDDFADTTALLKQMDCLITVDTAVAHLAGAMGVKTFLLISYCPDWRWGVTGETTDLYPSVTLVRQPKHGDWDSAISRLKNLLESGF